MFFWRKNNDNETNNDMISFINCPILIRTHKHPLIFCSTKRKNGWVCDKCSTNYGNVDPSFYCTYCDYDLCQKCLGKHKLNEIKKYKGNEPKFSSIVKEPKKSFDWQINFPSHNHLLSLIKRANDCTWTCNNCKKENNNNSFSHYCSLCDYDICEECYEKNQNTLKANISKSVPIKNDFCEDKSGDCEFSDGDDDYYVPQKRTAPIRYDRIFRDIKPCRKPVVYLYPEKEMDISVQLDLDLKKSKFTTIYPRFNKGNNTWNVHAKPNGDIQIKDKTYPYLFWEADSYFTEEMNEGFIINEENAESFLEEKLKILGLNEKESTDFITYWLPVLLKNKLSLCSFQSQKFFDDKKLIVTPKPDTMIRIFLCIKKIDSPISIKEQNLVKNERKGYTVIEWGGSNF